MNEHELLTKTQLEAWNSSFEISELRKDKERLDWVLSHEGRYWLSFREDIDREMYETTRTPKTNDNPHRQRCV